MLGVNEDRFERGDGRAVDANVYLDHGPEVDGDGVVEGVLGLGVDADGVETDNRSDAAEDAETEDDNES